MTKVKYEFKELNTSQKDKEFEKTKEEILSKISKISALKEYKKVLKEAKKWGYNNLELNIIQNRFFIMSEIETDQLKKLSLRNLYNTIKDFNETYGEKINESYK